jgi:hypothetical protein
MRATFLNADASLPWTFRGAQVRASRSLSLGGAAGPALHPCCIPCRGRASPWVRDREAYGARLYVMLRQPARTEVDGVGLQRSPFRPQDDLGPLKMFAHHFYSSKGSHLILQAYGFSEFEPSSDADLPCPTVRVTVLRT